MKKKIQRGIKKIKRTVNKLYIYDKNTDLTIKKMFGILEINFPKKLEKIKNNYVPAISMNTDREKYKYGTVYFQDFHYEPDAEEAYEKAKSLGAALCFLDKLVIDKKEDAIPVVVVKKPHACFVKLCKYIKANNKIKTICVTGSVGKTTAKQFIYCVLSQNNNVLENKSNANLRVHAGAYIQKISPKHDFYLQEVGGCIPEMVTDTAKMIDTDCFVVTNIGDSHIENYGSVENIQKDKLSFDNYMKKSGVAVLNYDDERLKKAKLKHRVISYAIDSTDADYYALDIVQKGNFLELNVCYQDKKVPVRVNAIGRHNAYPTLIAFAVGKHFGFTDEEIVNGLSNYKAEGTRQNLVEYSNRLAYIDCFNAAYHSIKSALGAIKEINVGENNKKIAVLGDILELGDISVQTHQNVGKLVNESDVNVLIAFGNDSKHILDTIDNKNIKKYYTNDFDELANIINDNLNEGDLILFKSSHGVNLSIAVDKVFGTSYFSDKNRKLKTEIKDKDILFLELEKELEIKEIINDKEEIVIESSYNNYNVVKVNRNSFKNIEASKVVLGNKMRNISKESFVDCKNLKEIDLGETLFINEKSFVNCEKLEKVIINNYNCHIEKDAFINCNNIVLFVKDNSYALEYAKENNIKFKILK